MGLGCGACILASMNVQTLTGQLVWPDGTLGAGQIVFDTHIRALHPLSEKTELFVLPGFIDTHVHGGGGGDTMDGAAGVKALARLHAHRGTTSLLPTTMTQPYEQIFAALEGVAEVIEEGGVAGGADILGVHLEGPFISPQRLGAQPDFTAEPYPERLQALLDVGVIRAVTLAPERRYAREAVMLLLEEDIRVGIGHTAASAEAVTEVLQAVAALGGRSSATHLFNGMGDIQAREPGAAGALLASPYPFIEVILDGHHLHDTTFLLARAAAPTRVMLISDAMRATGLGDGPSELGGQVVTVSGGRATLADGTLAGSVLTLDAALRRAVALGLGLPEVSRMLSLHPAQSLGLRDRGELRVGQRADLVVLGDTLEVQQVYVAGEAIKNPATA